MARYDENHDFTRLGSIHHNMKTRCNNPNYDKYQYYGGKGISVCDEWSNSYDAFEEWALSHGYADDLTLDRIDPDGDYTPENCRWVSIKEQANNRSSNHFLTYNGKTQTLRQWAEETGMSYSCLMQRVHAGWPVERIFAEPHHNTNKQRMVTYKGVTKRLHEWAKELGIKYNTLQNRLDMHHWSVEKAFEKPVVERSWHYDPERNYCHG